MYWCFTLQRIDWPCHHDVTFCSRSFWSSHFPLIDGLTHGKQAWRKFSGIGMAGFFDSWDPLYNSCCKYYRCPSHHDVDSFDTWWTNDYTHRPSHWGNEWYIYSSSSTCSTFPDTRSFTFPRSPPLTILGKSSPPNPLQDLYTLQQHPGAFYWRDTNIGNLQMSRSGTFLLRPLWQLGMVFTNCWLLAPSLRNSSTTWDQSLSACTYSDDWVTRWNRTSYHYPWSCQTTIRRSDDSDGIWRTWWYMENGDTHELSRCDSHPAAGSKFRFWIEWEHICKSILWRFTSARALTRPTANFFQKWNPATAGCVCVPSVKM